ncbi:DUF2889 domain-containing protein [Mycobacterium hodleri]|uniref:DUF2889 domain-containing protein n=2 Tax=Mycolicibacterium hodleri TaxID=49897 RepID=A0A502EI09_9MYCO|nr:DUF2889 domain-containing protein [Mycolicibacterium hodleri]
MTRNAGTLDPVYLTGIGRDLATAADGSAIELRHVGLTATVELVSRVIRHVETDPPVAGLSRLVGAPAMSGFRSAADEVAPDLRKQRDLLYTLIDDIPVATLISGHALSASGALGDVHGSGYLPVADQCAGFVTGGLLMTMFEDGDPVVVTGPDAPELQGPEDSLAWHEMAPLPIHGMRRRRRLDVSAVDDGANIAVDAMFRDTYVRGDGQETIIHEYTLAVTVDPESGRIERAAAVPRVLPWQECPGAVDSATRIVGMSLSDLHVRVRKELTGTTTCTHLNDLLRSVADARALMTMLREQ